MHDSAVKPVATDENQVLWEFSESESWSVHENEVTGELVAHRKECGETCGFPVSQKIQGILKLKGGNGHIIFAYLRQLCLFWTTSFRL